jgi:hypothetical protein
VPTLWERSGSTRVVRVKLCGCPVSLAPRTCAHVSLGAGVDASDGECAFDSMVLGLSALVA